MTAKTSKTSKATQVTDEVVTEVQQDAEKAGSKVKAAYVAVRSNEDVKAVTSGGKPFLYGIGLALAPEATVTLLAASAARAAVKAIRKDREDNPVAAFAAKYLA